MSQKVENIIAFVDAPDPDNFVMIVALAKLNPEANLHVVLTGRPIKFGADKSHKTWEWDMESSLMAQQASAMRIKNFLRHFGISVVKVYDGGIAPRTLVPHFIHFEEYYKFLDVDPLAALRHNELEPQEDLVKIMLEMDECMVVVGGPMTGLNQVIVRNPEVATRIKEVHAMFATWGEVKLMSMGDEPRGALQFNVACDPQAAHNILFGLECPIYLMPSEVTRVADIGFANAQALNSALPTNGGTRALYNLYALWYDAAVKPRQDKNPEELIFIHDLVGALSMHEDRREEIYEVVPIEILSVPYLPSESSSWGQVIMNSTADVETNRFAAVGLTPGGAKKYLQTLRNIFS